MAESNQSLARRSDHAKSNKLAKKLQDVPVIDVDIHTSFRNEEIQRDMLEHLDEPYRTQLEYNLRPDTSSYDGTYPTDTWDRDISGKLPTELMQVTDPVEDIEEVLSNEFHVDYPIVNHLPEFNGIQQTEKAVNLNKAANEVLVDRFLEGHDNFSGLATVVPHDPEAAAEEIERIATHDQIVGILLNTSGVGTPLGDPEYDPIYRAAEDNDLPMVYHGAAAADLAIDFPILQYELNSYFANHSLAHIFSQLLTLTSLIENGVPEKFPDLDFVFQEAGVAWISLVYRLNRDYKERRSEVPLLEKPPEDYVRDQFYFLTQPLEEPNSAQHTQQHIEMWADNLMFGTDHPHFDIDNTEVLMRHLESLSEEKRDKILYGNAADVFDIEVNP